MIISREREREIGSQGSWPLALSYYCDDHDNGDDEKAGEDKDGDGEDKDAHIRNGETVPK